MKYFSFLILLFFMACNSENEQSPTQQETTPKTTTKTEVKPNPIPKPVPKKEPIVISHSTTSKYPWISGYDVSHSLVNRFALPEGFSRVNYDDFPYADWLRHLPLKEKGSVVKYFNGGTKSNNVHEAVMDIDVGNRDLQQCADAVMRLQAEYHYSKKDYQNIHFNFTSGDRVSFDDWRQGMKPQINGNKVTFSAKNGNTDNSYSNFKKYMNMIFNYAGTASLEKELKKVNVKNIRPGDVFIQGGFPGHAVIVVDVAQNNEGKKIFMIAQSYMPAQDIHVLKNMNEPGISPWYSTDFGGTLSTPEWSFDRANLKRFQ